jgi:hypothetical protein
MGINGLGDPQGHAAIAFRDGKFVLWGDEGTSYESKDAVSWKVLAGIPKATFCNGAFRTEDECAGATYLDGVYLRPQWQGKIERSTDGKAFEQVYLDPSKATACTGRSFAKGWVAK